MSLQRLRGELEGRFWQATAPFRRALRRLRRELSIFRRRLAGEAAIVFDPPSGSDAGDPPVCWQRIEIADASAPESATPDLLRLVGELEGLAWIAGAPAGPLLLRTPDPKSGVRATAALGRILHPGGTPAAAAPAALGGLAPWSVTGDRAALGGSSGPAFVRQRARRVAAVSDEIDRRERATAVLLLPFLAVGGAERLLLDYARAVGSRRRLVVVTTEPHRAELGSLRAAIAPHAELYPLGDTLDRALHAAALSTILRRHAARALVAWNGCALFYELAPRLRRELPALRLVNQVYDHRVGWIRRITPALRSAVDMTIAVNRPIADELVHGRGLPAERVALVRHGVALAEPPSAAERGAIRRELGIPGDAIVAASFLRLHPQKRPGDLIAVARRLAAERLWLLLVGGGPLDGEVAAELARRPAPNVVRRPLEPEPARFFAAADLCLMASAYEGLPIFLLEGMSRGLPAVATAVGEIPELLADGAGGVAAVGDIEGLATAVRTLLDPERRRAAGAAARRTVAQRHSLERYVAETDAALFGREPRGESR